MTTTQHTEWAREYETIYILSPQVDPDEADRIGGKMSEVVERLRGKLTKVDNWGKRRLAYPIRKNTRGVFVYMRYVGFGDLVAELERNLRMLDSVIRHQTILLNDEVDPATVAVDPEEVKFRRLEVTPDEEEPGLEARLGMLEESRPQAPPDEVAPEEVSEPPPPAEEGAAPAAEAAAPEGEGSDKQGGES